MRILYGRGPGPPDEWGEPEVNFYQSGQGIETKFEGVNKVHVEEDKGVRWIDLMDSSTKRKWNHSVPAEPQKAADILTEFCADLKDDCNPESEAERKFLDLFVGMSFHEAFMSPSGAGPALIPNVWVNWYPEKEKRDRRKEPYLADFVVKHPKIEQGELTIIEIDGPSHYASFDEESREYTLSEGAYSSHLRDDRFLRRRVPKVIRIGRDEIRNVENMPDDDLKGFYSLWNRVFESEAWIETFEDVDPLP